MKIKCSKCSTLLTQDLYYAKVSYDKYHFLTPSYSQSDYRMKRGLFYIRKAVPSF